MWSLSTSRLFLRKKNGVSGDHLSLVERRTDKPSGSVLNIANSCNGRVSYLTCDVTSESSVAAAFKHIESSARFPLRGLVTLAGISGRALAIEYDIAAFRKILDVNVVGTFLCAQAAARLMHRSRAAGSIVMLASMSGTVVNQVSHALTIHRSDADGTRASTRSLTTHPSQRSCRWHATWRLSGATMELILLYA